ncbi:MAG: hypothetical protein ACR2GH_00665 [Pseudonocardia sp.]
MVVALGSAMVSNLNPRGARLLAAAAVVAAAMFAAAFSPIGERIGSFIDRAVLGREPLIVSANSNTDRFNFAGAPISMKFAFPVPSTMLPRPPNGSPDCTNRYTWAHSIRGEDFSESYGQLSLYAHSANVAVLGARVEVVERLAPTSGAVIGCEEGGPIDVRYLYIALDTLTAEFFTGSGVDDVQPFALHLAPGETEVVQFNAFSQSCDCRWRLILDVQIDGTPSEVVIDNNGLPFTTYAQRDVLNYLNWDEEHAQWVQAG